MVGRFTMNTSWLSTQLPQEMEGYTPVRWQLQEDMKLLGASHSLSLVSPLQYNRQMYHIELRHELVMNGALCSLHTECAGGNVAHSYGRLIPHEFPITDLQQISGPDGIGRINCTVSSGTARFGANGGTVAGRGVSEIGHGATVTLVVNTSNIASFQNKLLYCAKIDTNFFYLFISNASKCTSL